MSQEDKIKAAFEKYSFFGPVEMPLCYLDYKAGYLAAIEDIKARGPFVSQWKLRRDGFIQYANSPMDPNEFPQWDVTPLYRLED